MNDHEKGISNGGCTNMDYFSKKGSLPKCTSFMYSFRAHLNTNVVSFLEKEKTMMLLHDNII